MRYLLPLCLAFFMHTGSARAADAFQVGTGGITGTYYPSIEMLCKLVNQYHADVGECRVSSTDGSVFNINALHKGEIQFGIVQGDVLFQAHQGENAFAGQPHPELRAILALYPELLALVVREDSGIQALADIAGKKINLGNPGSGTEATVREFLGEAQIGAGTLHVTDLKAEECPAALAKGDIDGYFYMVGHPNKNIRGAMEQTAGRLILLDSAPVYSLVEKYPYYIAGKIPANLYKGSSEEISTFGVKATLVTTEDAPAAQVEAVLDALLGHFEEFRKLHPEPEIISKQDLVQGLSAPLHPAAKAYYEKAGLLNP